MQNTEQFYMRFLTESLYFIYEFERVVVRYEPIDRYFKKFKGEKELRAKSSERLVVDAILDRIEISKEQYDNY